MSEVQDNALTPSEQADMTIGAIEKTLSRIVRAAAKAGDDKLTARAHHVWKQAQYLHRQLGAAISGAAAAIQTLTEQRDQMAAELTGLVGALAGGKEYADPRLTTFAEHIRDDYTGDVYEQVDELRVENLTDMLVSECGYPALLAGHYACEILDLVSNEYALTPEQVGVFRALCATIDVPTWLQAQVDRYADTSAE